MCIQMCAQGVHYPPMLYGNVVMPFAIRGDHLGWLQQHTNALRGFACPRQMIKHRILITQRPVKIEYSLERRATSSALTHRRGGFSFRFFLLSAATGTQAQCVNRMSFFKHCANCAHKFASELLPLCGATPSERNDGLQRRCRRCPLYSIKLIV